MSNFFHKLDTFPYLDVFVPLYLFFKLLLAGNVRNVFIEISRKAWLVVVFCIQI